jgi:hypothetical protein
MAGGDDWQRLPLLVRLKGAFANRSGYPRKTRKDLKLPAHGDHNVVREHWIPKDW